MMEEDEEVVPKNSGLYACLVEAGFSDFESIDKADLTYCFTERVESYTNSILSDKNQQLSSNWSEYESYIQYCLKSRLIFAEDAVVIESFENFPKSPTEFLILPALKIVSYSIILGASYNACYFIRRNIHPAVLFTVPVFFVISHCVSQSLFIYKKYRRRKIITRLLSRLKELSIYTQKSVQFVLNSSILAFTSDESRTELENDTYFQEIVFCTLKSTILELKNATKSLVTNYPLKEPAETNQFYLAFLSDRDLHCVHPDGILSAEYLQKMKYAYFLLQSEFLRRICLSLLPNLQLNVTESTISQLFDRLDTTSNACFQLCHHLKSTFEMVYLLEKPATETRIRHSNTNWAHREAYVKLGSLSFNLQSTLRESRRLERLLEDVGLADADHNRIVTALDDGVRQIDAEYVKCNSALDDFRKYVRSLRPKRVTEQPTLASQLLLASPKANKTNIQVGVTDFHPQWPDEVFVGVSEVDELQSDTNGAPIESVVNPCAKLLISELKMALRDKAEEWKHRERNALKSKNVDESSDEGEEAPQIEPRHQQLAPVSVDIGPKCTEIIQQSQSTFAKQIAAVSASWGLSEEQHFSLGDDDNDSDDCHE